MLEEPRCYKRECTHYCGVKSDNDEEELNERNICVALLPQFI